MITVSLLEFKKPLLCHRWLPCQQSSDHDRCESSLNGRQQLPYQHHRLKNGGSAHFEENDFWLAQSR